MQVQDNTHIEYGMEPHEILSCRCNVNRNPTIDGCGIELKENTVSSSPRVSIIMGLVGVAPNDDDKYSPVARHGRFEGDNNN